MTASAPTPPHVEVPLSISPSQHSFSQPSPPTLSMTLLSHAPHPITIFLWDTPLHLQGCLTNNSITITDIATKELLPTTLIRIQRLPITRIRGGADEELYLTLLPGVPKTLTRPFGRGMVGDVNPLPRHIVEQGWELNSLGERMKIRRSRNATGVDGLEAGHTYCIGVDVERLERVWWTDKGKEEVLVDQGGQGTYVQDFGWEKERKVEWSVREAKLRVVE